MKTIGQLTSRELEIELLRRAIHRAAEQLRALSATQSILLAKQHGRIRELAIQETLLKTTQPTTRITHH